MTNPAPTTPPAAPATPPAPPPQPAVGTLSRELADFLVELSITLNKHAIYPQNHPLLDVAVDGVASRLGMLFVDERDSLSIGVARRQLIIEGVATDPLNPVLKELAQRLHQHHVGAVKFTRGITRDELAAALAGLSVDPLRAEKPIGHDTERLGEIWPHVRFFPLTYDRLQLIEDDPNEPPSTDKMLAGRATQLWIGLARAALVSDATTDKKKTDSDDDAALEPATVARAIDEHQREEAYDQVIVGYLLQIGEELKTAEGPEAAGLQRRVSHLVASLKQSTLQRLLEMGGDKVQRRKFLLDASQGITVEAVLDLVKAASAAEGQTVSHSMLRMLSKLAHHPSASGKALRGKTDPGIRDVMRRLIDDWTLEDPNPDAYRQALENIANLRNISDKASNGAHTTEVEPERLIQIAVEIGATGPQIHMAMEHLQRAGRVDTLLELVERAPSAGAAAPVWDFLIEQRVFETLMEQQRIDVPLVTRFAKRLGLNAAPALLNAAVVIEEAKTRSQFYDLLLGLGDAVGPQIAERLADAAPAVQRELLALIGKLNTSPAGFSALPFLESEDPLVRREAVRVMLKNPADRDETIVAALSDADDRVVFAGLSAAQEKCPSVGISLIKQRVDRGELDSQLRTMGIRIIAQQKVPGALDWLLGHVLTETNWSRRPKLRPTSPEMLAALSMIATHWRNDPAAETALKLAEQSRDPEVRAKLTRTRSTAGAPDGRHE